MPYILLKLSSISSPQHSHAALRPQKETVFTYEGSKPISDKSIIVQVRVKTDGVNLTEITVLIHVTISTCFILLGFIKYHGKMWI